MMFITLTEESLAPGRALLVASYSLVCINPKTWTYTGWKRLVFNGLRVSRDSLKNHTALLKSPRESIRYPYIAMP